MIDKNTYVLEAKFCLVLLPAPLGPYFFISLPVNVRFQLHWSPLCSPTCSTTGHLYRSLPCLGCFFPSICKAGFLTPLRFKYELLTEDVFDYPSVISLSLFGPLKFHILLSYWFFFCFLFFSSP